MKVNIVSRETKADSINGLNRCWIWYEFIGSDNVPHLTFVEIMVPDERMIEFWGLSVGDELNLEDWKS